MDDVVLRLLRRGQRACVVASVARRIGRFVGTLDGSAGPARTGGAVHGQSPETRVDAQRSRGQMPFSDHLTWCVTGHPGCRRGSVHRGLSPFGSVVIPLCGLPGGVGRAALPLFDLAPGGVCQAAPVTRDAGALLPHRFTLTCAAPAIGGLLSVALSFGSPRLAVTSTLPCGAPTFLNTVPEPSAATTHPTHRRGVSLADPASGWAGESGPGPRSTHPELVPDRRCW